LYSDKKLTATCKTTRSVWW